MDGTLSNTQSHTIGLALTDAKKPAAIEYVANNAGLLAGVPLIKQEPIRLHVTTEALIVLTASVFQWPIQRLRPLAIVGRFAKVDYMPVQGYDPDIILALGSTPGAKAFNARMLEFQDIRRLTNMNPGDWYRLAIDKAKSFVEPLYQMQAVYAEVKFVAEWISLICATGSRISDGLGVNRPNFDRQAMAERLRIERQEAEKRSEEQRQRAEQERIDLYKLNEWDLGSGYSLEG